MDCPQCGGTLATYALSGQEASVCEDCGYVGIAAEHRGDPRRVESWDDALRRFYGDDADPSVELRPPLSRPSSDGPTDESWDDALRRFYERRTDDDADDATDGKDESDDSASDADDGESVDGDDDSADDPASPPSQSSAGDS